MTSADLGSPSEVNALALSESPTLLRRYGAMIYEGVLLFAVSFIAGYLFDTLTQSRSGLMHRHGREVWLFVVYGAYFVYFWTHSGQTLAMKTWRIRLIWRDAPCVPVGIALVRYVACLFFVLVSTAGCWALALPAPVEALVLFLALTVPPLGMFLTPSRQFLHDALIGTRLVNVIAPVVVAKS